MMHYILNVVVIVLLCLTVLFCLRLNNKMSELKNSKKEMVDLAKMLDKSLINTGKSLATMKNDALRISTDLKIYVDQSHDKINELAFVNDSAYRLSERLEELISDARDVLKEAEIVRLASKKNKKHARFSKPESPDNKDFGDEKTRGGNGDRLVMKRGVDNSSKLSAAERLMRKIRSVKKV